MPPFISVITVCYNNATLLEKTIKSILKQKDNSVEYIVIDGASTDGTLELLEQYKRDIDCIISEADKGIYDAMNKGIKKAKGDYLIFANAGDTLCDNILYEIKEDLKKSFDVYYYGCFCVINVKGTMLSFEGPRHYNLAHEIPTCHNAMVTSRTAFNKYGLYNTAFRLCADYEWLCRNKENISTKHCEKKLINFLLGGASETDEITVLKEKADIARIHFGWSAFAWHMIRFIRVVPISILKNILIKIGVFDYYLNIKHMVKGSRNVNERDLCRK